MRKVILSADISISIYDVADKTPLFAKKDGKLVGMVVKEDKGWIIRIGGSLSFNGFWSTREDAIKNAARYGYEFFIE